VCYGDNIVGVVDLLTLLVSSFVGLLSLANLYMLLVNIPIRLVILLASCEHSYSFGELAHVFGQLVYTRVELACGWGVRIYPFGELALVSGVNMNTFGGLLMFLVSTCIRLLSLLTFVQIILGDHM
jgi:hypothetical protein